MAFFELKVRLFATKRFIVEADSEVDAETIGIDLMRNVPKGELILEFDVMEYEILSKKEAIHRKEKQAL